MRRGIVIFFALFISVCFGLPKTAEDVLLSLGATTNTYFVGVGKADVTGPIGSKIVGYDLPDRSTGTHTRLYSRAFMFSTIDVRAPANNVSPFVFVVVDRFMVSEFMANNIITRLNNNNKKLVFNTSNVVFSSTHTHDGTSCWSQFGIFQFSQANAPYTDSDFILEDGIYQSINSTFDNVQQAYVYWKTQNVSTITSPPPTVLAIQRAPQAFFANNRRSSFDRNGVSNNMTFLVIARTTDYLPLGMITWHSVQQTSMPVDATYISGDNKGVAAIFFERAVAKMRSSSTSAAVQTAPTFVGAFPNGAFGDTTPNIKGPSWPNGVACDYTVTTSVTTDADGGQTLRTVGASDSTYTYSDCKAKGPLWDFTSATKNKTNWNDNVMEMGRRVVTYAQLQHDTFFKVTPVSATALLSTWKQISGEFSSGIRYFNIAKETSLLSALPSNGCDAALGYSYLSGTVDGAIMEASQLSLRPSEVQGNLTGVGTVNQFYRIIVSAIAAGVINGTTTAPVACHSKKNVLATQTSETSPAWFSRTSLVQMIRFGTGATSLLSVNVPFAMTGVAGLTLTEAIRGAAPAGSFGDVIITGVANGYMGYVTTPAEYDIQRFEGGATVYGINTLAAIKAKALLLLSCVQTNSCPVPTALVNQACLDPDGNCPIPLPADTSSILNTVGTFTLSLFGDSPANGTIDIVTTRSDALGSFIGSPVTTLGTSNTPSLAVVQFIGEGIFNRSRAVKPYVGLLCRPAVSASPSPSAVSVTPAASVTPTKAPSGTTTASTSKTPSISITPSPSPTPYTQVLTDADPELVLDVSCGPSTSTTATFCLDAAAGCEVCTYTATLYISKELDILKFGRCSFQSYPNGNPGQLSEEFTLPAYVA